MLKSVILVCSLLLATTCFAQKGGGGGKSGSSGSGGASAASGTIRGGPGTIYPTSSGTSYGYPSVYNTDPLGRYPGTIFDATTGTMRTMTPQEERLQRMMRRQRLIERQKNMLTETDKMVNLANALQKDVSGKGEPSGDSAKKAGEIEKLAKNVKNQMTGEN